MTNYDPVTTATALAEAYTSGRQTLLDTQSKAAQSTSTALTRLQSALTAFDSAINALSSKKTPLATSAVFSNTAVGSATASASATAGSYSFFVEQLASANQVTYGGLTSLPVSATDSMSVKLGSLSFNVDLKAADTDSDGNLSAKEIAAAINGAPNNNSLVTASFVTVGGASQLVLTSNTAGAANTISLDTTGVAAGALKTALSNGSELVAAKDAIVWLGAQTTGVKLQQSSNTFTAIDGVSMTFTKAMATGEAPVTLTVASDDNATAANVQSFVDAYNKLEEVLDSLTNGGDAQNGVAAAAFANDSGVRALRSRLVSTIRESVGGLTLANYGVIANRDGSLSLDQTKLKAKLATNPDGLTQVFGSSGTTKSGVLGDLDTYLNLWTNSATGQIAQRKTAVTKLQDSFTERQATLDNQYNSAYERYLIQYTQLQTLQSQLSQTSSMFDALFSNDNS
ncbi:lateral flagellar hook-associated protein 2 [Noviherbaspirillum cavernae]|uniref:Flagellar hook-associated protein 2 n=1 Tax=Noviherbaspirillum cavernae TaxID=2320862 RepID=A0A418WWX2_9BURK|nr:lateral flagellar hook-associated protein 2 [Noviherbaspirillum cavernae]